MFATLDIGTHSTLALIANPEKDGGIQLMADRAIITKLGEGVSEAGFISKEAMDRTIAALKSYLKLFSQYKVKEVKAVGTAVLRNAQNATDFIKRVKNELGIDIEVLSAEKEARLTYESSALDFGKDIIVIDIGGGSTEFIRGPKPLTIISLPIGCVNLTEEFITSDPVYDVDEKSLRRSIFDYLHNDVNLDASSNIRSVVATAGTATTLMAMNFELEQYDSKLIHGQELSRDSLGKLLDTLRSKNIYERRNLAGLPPERAEVIFAGTVMLDESIKHLGCDKVTISDRGVRWGVFYEEFC
ncbi:MAG: Ppx/GppA family phosphatase [Deltaproteobacteria bacterium]|jgi:exopolyphosphatase / guanosine-5'-triphosphate,3'-diphosphate pyrophosphatase|nr:Ppx/GppA family phosphatase [Deltaproteobacteria bacterium]